MSEPLPRIRVAAVIMLHEQVLLVAHRKDDQIYHLLPGGGVESGETLQETLQREVREETGLDCALVKPLFLNDTISPDGRRHVVNVTFLAEVTGGELTDRPMDPRVTEVTLVRPDMLEALDLRPPLARRLRQAADRGFRDPTEYLGALWVDAEGGRRERTPSPLSEAMRTDAGAASGFGEEG